MLEGAETFLPSCFNKIYFDRVGSDKFRCINMNNLHEIPDNTKHIFKDMPNENSQPCIERLIKILPVETLCINAEGYDAPFTSLIS